MYKEDKKLPLNEIKTKLVLNYLITRIEIKAAEAPEVLDSLVDNELMTLAGNQKIAEKRRWHVH